jgi:hypothetical protein
VVTSNAATTADKREPSSHPWRDRRYTTLVEIGQIAPKKTGRAHVTTHTAHRMPVVDELVPLYEGEIAEYLKRK